MTEKKRKKKTSAAAVKINPFILYNTSEVKQSIQVKEVL
jgi:hypothetical protein